MPSSANNKGVEVDGCHGEVAPSATSRHARRGGSARVVLQDVTAEVKHGDAAQDGTPDEALAAADALDNDKGESDHTKGLEATIETGREQLGTGACDSQGLKDARRVVGNDVDAGEGL